MLLLKFTFTELKNKDELVYNLTDKGFESLDSNHPNRPNCKVNDFLVLKDEKLKSKIISDIELKGDTLVWVKLIDNGKKIIEFAYYNRISKK